MAQIDGELGKFPDGDPVLDHEIGTEGNRQEEGEPDNQGDGWIKQGIHPGHGDVFLRDVGGQLFKVALFRLFLSEGLYHADAGDVFLNLVVEGGKGFLRLVEPLVDQVAVMAGGPSHEGHGKQGDQRQLPVDEEGHGKNDCAPHKQRVHQGEDTVTGGHLNRIDVVGGVGHQVSGAALMEEPRGEERVVVVQPLPQQAFQPETRTKEQNAPNEAQDIKDDGRQTQEQQPLAQLSSGEIPLFDRVDDNSDDIRRKQFQQGDHKERQDSQPVIESFSFEIPPQIAKDAHKTSISFRLTSVKKTQKKSHRNFPMAHKT